MLIAQQTVVARGLKVTVVWCCSAVIVHSIGLYWHSHRAALPVLFALGLTVVCLCCALGSVVLLALAPEIAGQI